jgi:hypothetical protein
LNCDIRYLFSREVRSPAIARRTRSRDKQPDDTEVVIKPEKAAREGSKEKVCITVVVCHFISSL